MPFIIVGLIILIVGFLLYRMSKKSEDPEGTAGAIGIMIAGLLFVFVVGILYRLLINVS